MSIETRSGVYSTIRASAAVRGVRTWSDGSRQAVGIRPGGQEDRLAEGREIGRDEAVVHLGRIATDIDRAWR